MYTVLQSCSKHHLELKCMYTTVIEQTSFRTQGTVVVFGLTDFSSRFPAYTSLHSEQQRVYMYTPFPALVIGQQLIMSNTYNDIYIYYWPNKELHLNAVLRGNFYLTTVAGYVQYV
jgi:hypothetical protein